MKFSLLVLGFFLIGLNLSCHSNQSLISAYESDHLKLVSLSKKTYLHISYLETKEYGNVACNGMVFIDQNEAIIFDTPSTDAAAIELIDWLTGKKQVQIKAVVINHFHDDCLGSLQIFHNNNIASFAHRITIDLAQLKEVASIPQHGFDDELSLSVGSKQVINRHHGEAHTKDNIVSYLPSERILFGGCQIKALGSGKGNLADADVNEWSRSVQEIRDTYTAVKQVVPGHGNPGTKELFEYTIKMFSLEVRE